MRKYFGTDGIRRIANTELSPELAQANKSFKVLKDFEQNEGIKEILRPNKKDPGTELDKASRALRNYNSTITSGNKNIPAIGFSLDINSVIENVKVSEKAQVNSNNYKIYYSQKDRIEAIRKSEELRNQGKVVELIPDDDIEEIKVVQ